ncbi:MAG TPA: low affinity iron permease family protein [Candidatus Limnocylindria bacterium]|nr:low affinity iron permease family protein [Candidatus Limnocylindria bacterium]
MPDGGHTGRTSRAAAAADERVDDPAHQVSPFKAWFGKVATRVSDATGSVWTFALAIAVIAAWAVSGPLFGFSDTWQLVANTFTTLVTFLRVFLIQNTQNRDAKATELKLDELIRAIGDGRNQFIGAESEPDEQLARETREIEAEKNKPAPAAADERRVDPPSRNGKPHNGEPAGQR